MTEISVIIKLDELTKNCASASFEIPYSELMNDIG